MPLNLSVPLPGPFSYSKRLSGGHQKGGPGLIWWLFVGLWWVPLKWLLVGLVWVTVAMCRVTVALCRAGVLYWARQQHPTQAVRK